LFAHQKAFFQGDLLRHACSFLVRDLADRVNAGINGRMLPNAKNHIKKNVSDEERTTAFDSYLEDFIEDADVEDARNETGAKPLNFMRTWNQKNSGPSTRDTQDDGGRPRLVITIRLSHQVSLRTERRILTAQPRRSSGKKLSIS
jgi:hypothetical protein